MKKIHQEPKLPAPRDRSRGGAVLVTVAVVIVVLSAVVALTGRLNFVSRLPALRNRTTRSAQMAVLAEWREILQVQTVEYVYRSVFPFDFMAPGISVRTITDRILAGTGSLDEILSPVEREYLRAHNLAAGIGIKTGHGAYEFLVVTVVVRAGYSLDETVPASPGTAGSREPDRFIRVVHDPDRVAVVRLPSPRITEVIVEDIDPETYIFPDRPISPEHWKELAAFIRERVVKRTIENGILDAAERNGRAFTENLLLQAGFDRVEFLVPCNEFVID